MESKTLSELAEITRTKPRTIQFWTSSGVLAPEKGTKHGGPGVHRRYGVDDVTIACVIAEIARYGLQIGTLLSVSEKLRSAFGLLLKLAPLKTGTVSLVFDPEALLKADLNEQEKEHLYILQAIYSGITGDKNARLFVVVGDDAVTVEPSISDERDEDPDRSSYLTVNLGRILPAVVA